MVNRSLISFILAISWIGAPLPAVGPRPPTPVPATPRVSVSILMYHHLGVTDRNSAERQYYVSAAAFEAQMFFLAQHAYTPVTLEQIAAALDGGPALPPRPVALTFDDANQDNYDLGMPILEKYHLFATFLIVTHWVGTPGHLTWDEIATMQRAGMRFGAHTRSHPYLPNLPAALAADEIAGSQADLAAHLGQPVLIFAYPYGHTAPLTTRLVQAAGFVLALGTSPFQLEHSAADRFYLTRFGVYDWTTLPFFSAHLSSGTAAVPASPPIHLPPLPAIWTFLLARL